MATSSSPLVQLHYASLDLLSDKRFSEQIFSWLSLQEQKRYQRFVSKQQACQFLLARGLLRSELSKRVQDVLPHEWAFVIGDYGKPRLADRFSYLNLHFNVSHSEDLVVLALGDGLSLGVDVEYIHRSVFSIPLAKRYFAKTELADLMKLTEQQRIERIAQLWTLKESYLKASGVGIRGSLDKLAFRFVQACGLGLSVSPSCIQFIPSEDRSVIGLFRLGSDYSLALTLAGDKKVDVSIVAVNEWAESNSPPLGLPCELLRKTAVSTTVETFYEML